MNNKSQQWNTPLVKVIAILVFIALSQMWSSEVAFFTSTNADRPPYGLGFVGMGILIVIAALSFWWLLFSPIATPIEQDRSPETRRMFRLVGYWAVLSSVAFVVGGTTDALQHALKRSLIFEAQDFLSIPHFIIYGSFLINTVVSGIVLGRLIFGKGDMRVRARKVMPLTVFALSSAYLIFSAPTDLVWHVIYGKDITAWSIPHTALVIMTAIASIAGTALLMAAREPNRNNIGLYAGVIGLLMCWSWSLILLLTAQTEWFGEPVYTQIPGWVRPCLIALSGLVGAWMANNLLGRSWMATTVALLILLVRFLTNIGADLIQFNAPMLIITPFLLLASSFALDTYYAMQKDVWQFSTKHAMRSGIIFMVVYWIAAYIGLAQLGLNLLDVVGGAAISLVFILLFCGSIMSLARGLATYQRVRIMPVDKNTATDQAVSSTSVAGD